MYEDERATFRKFKVGLEANRDLLREVEQAVKTLLSEYNTTIHENRFVVGGVLEWIIGAAMRASGIAVSNVGRDMRRIDISVPGAQGFSVKGSFTKGAEIRLINVLGKGVGGGWQEATIFVLTKIGIAYADPEVLPDAASPRGDAIVLKRRKLEEFLRGNDGYLIQCDIAPKSADTENTKVASEAVAKDLLNEFRTLK